MKIKAILMDMDGTLLGKSQVAVSVRNMRAVQKAIDKGVHVIPCTGRVFDMLPPQLLTQQGLRYFVTSHGARAYDSLTGESLFTDLIPADRSAELMRMLEGKGLYNEIAADTTIFFEKSVTDNLDMSLVPEHHIWYVRDNCFTAVEKPSEHFLANGIGVEKMNSIIYEETKTVIAELFEKAKLKKGSIVVVGCSTSEVVGSKIGTDSNYEVAGEIFSALHEYAESKGVFLAIQCCEHLNRAIVVEQEAVPYAETVNVVPQPKAGGSLATQAYAGMRMPVIVEEIRADAGIDIGFTLIGMHLKKVAVPLRLDHCKIGKAMVLAARTRPKFIGGVRAVYNEELL